MQRISTNMGNDDLQYIMRRQEGRLNRMQNQTGSGQRIQDLRDDPVGAAHATRYQALLHRMNQFSDNVETTQANLRVAEGYMSSAQDILQRLNELTIQGAHGTYAKEDLKAMGQEVDQYLRELVQLSNAKGADGRPLFSGDRTDTTPFRVTEGKIPGGEGSMITNVDYVGTINGQKAEVMENAFMETNFPGNQVFWADNQQVMSAVDAQNYQVPADTRIYVDGKEVNLRAGDNVHAIMAKINAADVAVKTRLDPVTNAVVAETTVPHQLWLQDAEGSTVLQDLGLLSRRGQNPPNNLHEDARTFGGSLFDAVIQLRDNLYAGNQEAIGGRVLAGMQAGMNNMVRAMTELGARDERLQVTYKTLEKEIPEVTGKLAQVADLDMAEGITNLKMLEYTNKAALQMAGKVLPPTLLDYLR